MSKLFEAFDSVSEKQWKQKIQADLKGADYNDTLIWNTNDGIDVKPFYHSDDFEQLPKLSNTKATAWKICQTITVTDAIEANTKAIDAVTRGAESIRFSISDPNTDIATLVNKLEVPLYIVSQFLDTNFVTECQALDSNLNIQIDTIGNLAQSGNWYTNLNTDKDNLKQCVAKTQSLTVGVDHYQNAGANTIQQLAYALAHINEYYNDLQDDNLSTITVTYNVAVGTNYFFEIAKLRALRQLHATLAEAYQANTNCKIIATPTKRNKTIYDYNTNLLRTTTEYMSAILGGADVVNTLAYDAIYHNTNEFGERIARNQLLILKHESYFNKVNNPADGAYYIESLTTDLAEKGLALFKDIETNGGFLHQLKAGTIQRKIKESATLEQEQFDNEQLILLGTNKHPNPKDKMKHDLEINPFLQKQSRKTLIEPIIEKRLAETIEQQRLQTES